MTRTLALLCCLLVLLPGRAHAYPNVWLGAGYASSCLVGEECRRGARGELSLDLTGWERSKVDGGGTKVSSSAKGGGDGWGGNCGSGNCSLPKGGGGGDALALIAVILLAALVAYGLYLGVAALVSSEISLNVYASQDALSPPGSRLSTDKDSQDVARRWGLRTVFYPSAVLPLRLHFGAGPVSSLTRQRVDEATGQAEEAAEDADVKREYRDGFASHMGVGLAPHPGESGLFLVYEAEYLTLAGRTVKDFIKDNKPTRLPQYGVARSLMTGVVVGF